MSLHQVIETLNFPTQVSDLAPGEEPPKGTVPAIAAEIVETTGKRKGAAIDPEKLKGAALEMIKASEERVPDMLAEVSVCAE